MRMLWTAELQARQFGVRGSTDPLDNAQLPLLATMQFDGFTNQGPAPGFVKLRKNGVLRGEKVFKLVKWPKDSREVPTNTATVEQCGAAMLCGRCRWSCKLSQLAMPFRRYRRV